MANLESPVILAFILSPSDRIVNGSFRIGIEKFHRFHMRLIIILDFIFMKMIDKRLADAALWNTPPKIRPAECRATGSAAPSN
jgi:hypothetical protein